MCIPLRKVFIVLRILTFLSLIIPLQGYTNSLKVTSEVLGCLVHFSLGYLLSIPRPQLHQAPEPQLVVPQLVSSFFTRLIITKLSWDNTQHY